MDIGVSFIGIMGSLVAKLSLKIALVKLTKRIYEYFSYLLLNRENGNLFTVQI